MGLTLMTAAFVIMMIPSYQPLVDLPAHVAHFYYSLGGGRPPSIARFIEYRWQLIPTLGSEILVWALAPLIGLDLATRLVVAAVPALMAGGLVALARVVHGRVSPFTLIASTLSFNYSYTFGFLNFCLAATLALWSAALWLHLLRSGRSWHALAFGLIVSPLLMLVHLVGWALFGIIAVGASLALALQQDRGVPRAITFTLAWTVPLAWPVAVLLLQRSNTSAGVSGWFEAGEIVRWAASVVRERWVFIDLPSAAILYLLTLAPVLLPGRFRYAPALLVPAALTWLAVLVVPLAVFASLYANVRMIPYALALTLLAIQPKTKVPAWGWYAAGAFVVMRFAVVLAGLALSSATITAQLGALDHIDRGSKVLSFEMEPCRTAWAPIRSRNVHLYATVKRDALINGQFMVPGQHLLRIDYPPAGQVMMSGGNIVREGECPPRLPYEQALKNAPLKAFDYLWLIDVAENRYPKTPGLRPIWRGDGSALFRVVSR